MCVFVGEKINIKAKNDACHTNTPGSSVCCITGVVKSTVPDSVGFALTHTPGSAHLFNLVRGFEEEHQTFRTRSGPHTDSLRLSQTLSILKTTLKSKSETRTEKIK